MVKPGIEPPKAPIGFLSSLWKGVETVNSHLWLLAIPVLLDAFLWFGPHLTIADLSTPVLRMMESTIATAQADPTLIAQIRDFLLNLNLFSFLSFLPLFPPSIMAARVPVQTPLGQPILLSINNPFLAVVLMAGLVLGSIGIGSLYLVMAGKATGGGGWSAQSTASRWIRTVIVMLTLLIVFGVLLISAFLFGMMVFSLVGILWLSGAVLIMRLLVFAVGGLFLWLVIFLIFSPHGTVLYADGILRAMWNSMETARWIYPMSMWIPILILILNMFVTSVWTLTADNDWAGILSVLGNAYTSSVLVTASLVYYRDKRRWIEEVRALIQSQRAASVPPIATS